MHPHPPIARALALLSASALCACSSPALHPAATARLLPTGAVPANSASGDLQFVEERTGLRIVGEVRNLSAGAHGFHIHEKGDCADNGNAAGGHFNPRNARHGRFGEADSHAGDLPSLMADAEGRARVDAQLPGLSLSEGQPGNIRGRALVVHRDPDDYSSQPAGNSGPRIACAVIGR